MKDWHPNKYIPTKQNDFLKSFLGKRITRFIRYSCDPAENCAEEYLIKDDEVFSLAEGALLVCFENGKALGVSSDDGCRSVYVWNEKNDKDRGYDVKMEDDPEYFAISADDPQFSTPFWKSFVGKKLTRLDVMKNEEDDEEYCWLPNERALRFTFEDGSEFYVTYNLHQGRAEFTVIEKSQMIPIELYAIPIS